MLTANPTWFATEWSVYPFFAHASLTMQEKPKYVLSQPTTANEN